MRIAIGADHRGYRQKEFIKGRLKDISWLDVGASDARRSDYPIFAHAVCDLINDDSADRGILLCGSGIGMAMAANRYPGIYAGVAWKPDVAIHGRRQDNMNVLVIPSDFVPRNTVLWIVKAWLDTRFGGARYQERLDMIDDG